MNPIHRSVLLLTAILLPAWSAEMVIVNAANPNAEISKDDLSAMFEGKKANWADGAKVVLVTMPDTPAHEAFLKANVGKTPSQFATAWKKIVFTGKGSAPSTAKTEAEAIELVSKTPGAIGYISDEGLKGIAAGGPVKAITVK